MIEKLKHVLNKSRHNPRYIWYYWQNLHYCRNHFPAIYSIFNSFKRSKEIDLGERSGIEKLHVILRTTDCVMNMNASRQLEDIGIGNKNDVIKVGGCSLFNAGSQFVKKYGVENFRVTLVVDRLSDAGMSQYRKAASDVGLSFDVVEAKSHGNGPTFQTQIDVALQDTDNTLVLILEDDYLLDDDAFTTCFDIMQNHSKVIGMNPHFHPDRVRRQDIGELVVIDGKLYCRIYNTCCTFFIPVCQIRQYETYLRTYDGWEDGSVNSVWEKGLCLSPLGWTLSEHLHRNDLSPVASLLNKTRDS